VQKRPTIVIDTREQAPWSFDPAQFDVQTGTLRTGDYALAGDAGFAIERKGLDDFLGTISSGWDRFLREIGRMYGFPAKVVIVEGDYWSTCFRTTEDGRLVPPDHRHPMLTPQFVAHRIASLTLQGVTILFAGNAQLASGLAGHILKERYHDLTSKG
jgi:ERCC4-type nuclease